LLNDLDERIAALSNPDPEVLDLLRQLAAEGSAKKAVVVTGHIDTWR